MLTMYAIALFKLYTYIISYLLIIIESQLYYYSHFSYEEIVGH